MKDRELASELINEQKIKELESRVSKHSPEFIVWLNAMRKPFENYSLWLLMQRSKRAIK